jgi:chromosome segregation ATPase
LVQSVLVFVFGFLAAGLLALMVAPAIWRRAVYLTRKRIESSLPLSINELNAEKDKLRAEHAMELRRTEARVHKLQERDTKQKVNLADQSSQIRELEQKVADNLAAIAKLEHEVEGLTEGVHERTAELSETSILLESSRAEAGLRTAELRDASRHLERMSSEAEDLKSDLAGKNAEIDAMSTSIAELRATRKELQQQVRALRGEAKTTGDLLASERKRFAQIEERLAKSIAVNSDLEERLDRRQKELKRVRAQSGVSDGELREMEMRVLAADKERFGLESEIGELTLRINRMMSTFGDKEPETAVSELQAKMAQQSAELTKVKKDRDALKAELEAARSRTDPDDPKGDAVLREKLNQLAAEVVSMAARLEGPKSRINTLLAADTVPHISDVVSLADRIKALQRNADGQRNVS